MSRLELTIRQAIADLDAVRAAIIDSGVPVPPETPVAEYGAKILEIATTVQPAWGLFAVGNSAPVGAILIWGGALSNIPAGYQLCDGTNGAPDLQDRFVVGAGSSYASGDIGGESEVELTADQLPAHTHDCPHLTTAASANHNHTFSFSTSTGGKVSIYGGSSASSSTLNTSSSPTHTHTFAAQSTEVGNNQGHNNIPPYYALFYIIKTGAAEAEDIPSKAVIMWHGDATAVPEGWRLCNGENNTPDMQNCFILGAGGEQEAGEYGGADSETLTLEQLAAHQHLFSGNTDAAGAHTHTFSGYTYYSAAVEPSITASGSTGNTNTGGAHTHSVNFTAAEVGGGEPHENRPPYCALYYIMKE